MDPAWNRLRRRRMLRARVARVRHMTPAVFAEPRLNSYLEPRLGAAERALIDVLGAAA